ncbi:radical SAM protein [Desulfotomaculum copahuensis]|uniref:radical SAM protein n=1 Tax=Desulfotomaculum copahuensis TaxID=1838280 RepID=UPI00098ED8F0|nr:radical SAM protein [Desulfotomaculum copahuensis]
MGIEMKYYKAVAGNDCLKCGFCKYFVQCPMEKEKNCIGCGTCLKGCPAGDRSLKHNLETRTLYGIVVDGNQYFVPARISVRDALELVGKRSSHMHHCNSGGCFTCEVMVNGNLMRSCLTPVNENMVIFTNQETLQKQPPLRLVSFFPNYFHASLSVFTHGCNFSCGFCHNWNITFSSSGRSVTSIEAVQMARHILASKTDPRVGISGGEPTLNRRWLIDFIRELRKLYSNIRIQLDTNASLLTNDYIDELYDAGLTDISPDLKGDDLSTFMKLTGIKEKNLANRYLETAWEGVKYLVNNYHDRINLAVAIPYHPSFISRQEIERMGKRLANMDNKIDVNLIIYQPVFRMRSVSEVSDTDIDEALELLKDAGLQKVWCQEGDDIPRGVSPEDLLLLEDGS